ncbi:MAG: hypothetical protein ABUS54_04405 [Actinomycetota bacterium]
MKTTKTERERQHELQLIETMVRRGESEQSIVEALEAPARPRLVRTAASSRLWRRQRLSRAA